MQVFPRLHKTQSDFSTISTKVQWLVLHTYASKKAMASSLLYHPVLSVLLSEEVYFSAKNKQDGQNFVPSFGCQVNKTRDANMKFSSHNTHKSKELTRTQPPHLVLGHRKGLWYQTHMAWTSLSPAQTAQYDNHGLLCILDTYFPVLLFQPTYCKSEKKQNEIWNLFHWVALYVECCISLSVMSNIQITTAKHSIELS